MFQVSVRIRRTLAPKVEAVGQNWHVFNTVSRAVNGRFLETEAQTTYTLTQTAFGLPSRSSVKNLIQIGQHVKL